MFAAIGANWFTARRQRVSVISINRFHPTILANYVSICVANVTDCPLNGTKMQMTFQNCGKNQILLFKSVYVFTFRFSGWHGWLSISKGVNIPWLPVLKHRPMKIILVANILTQFLRLKWHLKQNDSLYIVDLNVHCVANF